MADRMQPYGMLTQGFNSAMLRQQQQQQQQQQSHAQMQPGQMQQLNSQSVPGVNNPADGALWNQLSQQHQLGAFRNSNAQVLSPQQQQMANLLRSNAMATQQAQQQAQLMPQQQPRSVAGGQHMNGGQHPAPPFMNNQQQPPQGFAPNNFGDMSALNMTQFGLQGLQPQDMRQLQLMNMASNQQNQHAQNGVIPPGLRVPPQQLQGQQQQQQPHQQQGPMGGPANAGTHNPNMFMPGAPQSSPQPAQVSGPPGQVGVTTEEDLRKYMGFMKQLDQHSHTLEGRRAQIADNEYQLGKNKIVNQRQMVQARFHQTLTNLKRTKPNFQLPAALLQLAGPNSAISQWPGQPLPTQAGQPPAAQLPTGTPQQRTVNPQPTPSPLQQAQANRMQQPQNYMPPRSGPTPQQMHQPQPGMLQSPGMPAQYPAGASATQPLGGSVDLTKSHPTSLNAPTLSNVHFRGLYGQFCKNKGFSPDPQMLLVDNRTVDLHLLHVHVMLEGGYVSVKSKSRWDVIVPRVISFAHFPASATEPARSGPAAAEHMEHIYATCLKDFEDYYCELYQNQSKAARQPGASGGAPPPNAAAGVNASDRPTPAVGPQMTAQQQHAALAAILSDYPPPKWPELPPQARALIARYIAMSKEQLQTAPNSETLIRALDYYRPQLQHMVHQNQLFHAQLQQQRNQQPQQQHQPMPGQGPVPQPGQQPQQSGPPQQQGLPNGQFMPHQFPGVPPQPQFPPGFSTPGAMARPPSATANWAPNQAMSSFKPTSEQVQAAVIFIQKAKDNFAATHKQRFKAAVTGIPQPGMQPHQLHQIPEEQVPTFRQVIEYLKSLCASLENNLIQLYFITDESTLERLMLIMGMVEEQRILLQSDNPKFLVNLTNLRLMIVTVQEAQAKMRSWYQKPGQTPPSSSNAGQPPYMQANVPRPQPGMQPHMQGQITNIGVAPTQSQQHPTQNQAQFGSASSHVQSVSGPLMPQSAPSRQPPAVTGHKPSGSISKKKPPPLQAGQGSSPAAAAASTSTPPTAAAATPSASTPASTPAHAPSPQTPKSPKGKNPAKAKGAAAAKRRASKVVPAAVAPAPPVSEPVRPPSASNPLKRQREEDSDSKSMLPPQVPDSGSPPKKLKTDWEGPPSEELVVKQEEIESILTDEDATQYFKRMTDSMKVEGHEHLTAQLEQSLDEILRSFLPPNIDTIGGTGAAAAEDSSLNQPAVESQPSDADAFAFIDFSSYGNGDEDENESKPPTPGLSVSSTNPSPASNADPDLVAHAAVKIEPKFEDVSDSDQLHLSLYKEIDGGVSAYYQSDDSWKWEGTMTTSDQPWAFFTTA